MKTWLISHANFAVLDSQTARLADFHFLQKWTGHDESSDSQRESFAERYAWEDDEPDDDRPFRVQWDSHSYIDTRRDLTSTTVATFPTEEEAEACAAKENLRIQREYLRSLPNFTLLHLPDGWEPDFGTVNRGKYPQSRRCGCSLTAHGHTVEAVATWDTCISTDDWPRHDVIRATLVDLIDQLALAIAGESEDE